MNDALVDTNLVQKINLVIYYEIFLLIFGRHAIENHSQLHFYIRCLRKRLKSGVLIARNSRNLTLF